ncbi:aldehyde dehydrogenase family protein [Hwanghaeella sp.]|uniref:aldehyde dehydrogenase family protein n=1 Tax=Hwanghaeella sp. TaxID=2605943 RepID=UPI003CCBFECD
MMDVVTSQGGAEISRCLLLSGGEWVAGEGPVSTVLDKYSLSQVAEAPAASQAQIETMIAAAQDAFRADTLSPYQRGEILDRAVAMVAREKESLARIIQLESGFTKSDALGEVTRCMQTLSLSAEEARRLKGDVIPMSGAPNQGGRMGFTLRVPLGVVLAVTPFNSPLNTVTHKVGPALAAGNAVILKPASATPMTSCKLAEILVEAGVPKGMLSVIHGGGDVVQSAIADQRIRFIAFTGSTEVGRKIQQAAGLRRTQMELGSIAYTILCDDADLDRALPKIVAAGYRKAGQVCTSVQMLLAHASIMEDVAARMTDLVGKVKYGDPSIEGTVTGPLISEEDAIRVEAWVEEAVEKGARRLVGGPRQGTVVPPTLLTGVTDDMKLGCSEIFGPVVCLKSFNSINEAIDLVNATPYGLATGIFTNRLSDGLAAAKALEVGGVHINETSSSRIDLMPYGGSKDSGFGREGPHYAVEEMTEERIVTIST